MRSDRYAILLICVAGIACFELLAQPPSLVVERQGNYLHVTAPRMHFLEGKPLEQLYNGASVTYEFALTLTSDQRSKPLLRPNERFILSYDLWEEKFSVVQAGQSGHTGSHLTAAMAEAWCLDNLPVPLSALPAEKPFVLKLECRIAENGNQSAGEGSAGLTLAGLIDLFSRKRRETPPHWEASSGSLRLAEVKDRKQTP